MGTIDRRHGVSEGTAIKAPCRAGTTENIVLTGEQTVDGVALIAGDRVLVKNQADATRNGIYDVSTGNWSRTRDFDGAFDAVKGTGIRITDGASNIGLWEITNPNPIEIGVTALSFALTTNAISGLSAFVQGLLDKPSAAAFMSAIGSLPADFVTTLALLNNAVTYAKIQNVSAANRLLGRVSAGAGIIEEVAVGTALTLSGTTLSGVAPVVGSFKNLSVKVASTTTVAVAADAVVMSDGAGYQTATVSATINLSLNGAVNRLDAGTLAAATWYAIWVIARPDGTVGALASLSASAPTMPTGYTFKARVGWVRTATGSALLMGTWQLGRTAQYVVGLSQTTATPIMISGVAGNVNTPVWTAVSVLPHVPTTASKIRLYMWGAVSSTGPILAPNSSYGANGSTTNPPPMQYSLGGGNVYTPSIYGEFLLESSSIYYASPASTIGVSCLGWEDNL